MLLLTAGELYWDLFIGFIGMGFLIYGKKKPDLAAIVAGFILVAYPYFVGSIAWNIAIGVAVVAIYAFLKRVVRL